MDSARLTLNRRILGGVAQDCYNRRMSGNGHAGAMTSRRLRELLEDRADQISGDPSRLQFFYRGVQMMIVTDESVDRMRIIAPIRDAVPLKRDEMVRLLEANFDTALDARYAISHNQLWAAFLHSLAALGEGEFLAALDSTANLVVRYGDSYASGDLKFTGDL